MQVRRFLLPLFLLIATSQLLFADASNECFMDDHCCEEPSKCMPGNIFSIGPEIYYVKRTRKGGTSQHGGIFGVRATYDHIKRYNIYVGGQAFYGTGILKGHTGSGNKIKSRFTDQQLEGVLGYTFQMKNNPQLSFTPFAGYGYFWETNKFISPSPLHLKFRTTFQYVAFGFLSSGMINSCFKIGLNARFKYPWDTKCKVSNDPEFEDLNQLVGNHIHYRIELPLTYCGPIMCLCEGFELAAVPFFESRVYGGRENFPFDFFETKLRIYGINFQLIYAF